MESKKYDYLIVPCAGNPRIEGGEVKLEDLEDDKLNSGQKLYLGANDRMKAALLFSFNANKIVLIGGSESKVLAMRHYFYKQLKNKLINKEEKFPEFICLVSNPDSTGNLSAFMKHFLSQKFDSRQFSIAIISNDYHIDRLKKVWDSLLPSISYTKVDFKLVDFIKTTIVLGASPSEKLYQKELFARQQREESGCVDWDHKIYRNQDKIMPVWDFEFWDCKELKISYTTSDISM